jgi:hypothetical protein
MNIFFQHLNSPEYMHVLLNPIPVYGLAIGVVGLLMAVIARNRPAIVIALALVFLSGLSAWPTYHHGEAAYDRVTAMADTAGDQWLDEHMARAEKLIWAFYVLAGLAVVAIVAPIKWPRNSFAARDRHPRHRICHARHRRMDRLCGRSRPPQRIPVRAATAAARTPS